MSPWTKVAPELDKSIRKDIRAGKRMTLEVAQHMWNNGWSEKLVPLHFYWAKFLKFISDRYFRIETWANEEKSWAEMEESLFKDAQTWDGPA